MSYATNPEIRMKIREFTLDDIPKVLRLERVIFPDPWSAAAFKEQVAGEGWGGIVAESDDEIIGYACYYIVANESHLTNMAVDPKYRRKSVAKRLLDNILQVVTEGGCEYIFLEVRPSNSGAIAFYEKCRFEVLYRRPNYYRQPVEDALVMGRHIAKAEQNQQL
ncbi:MAG: ribosomal protein S18-alanine N-acetyltransferase [Candidatus Zixiibacteriota bacterium]|nr:MAG: ribosomal protein S18-alanine N-acetyltransferase [candidate division Zixibacteria bacterium]